jgi:hypothetical protein
VRWLAPALAVAVAACTQTTEAARPPDFAPDPAGIALVGSPLRIDFGRAETGTIAAVTRLEGRGPTATTACPGGGTAVRWASGLTLHFRGGAFLGWARPDGSAAGIGC